MNLSRIISVSAVAASAIASSAFASPGHPAGGETVFGQPGDAQKVARTVRIVASEIKFDISSLSFKVGETVKFVLVNTGEQDHELTIGDQATQLEHRKIMQDMAQMQGMEMSNMSGHKHSDESMVVVKPGETKELVWQFTKAGKFEFACNFPGHAEVGMAGTIVVG